jgi:DNA-binding response OmpR family regulator
MKKNILSVDNEPLTVELVKVILEKEGYKVITALSGKECIRQLEKNKIDLILLDVMMPDLSGWDVYQRIRAKNKKVKVIFLSILEISPDRKKQLLKEGVSDYIIKPFNAQELAKKVGLILLPKISKKLK